jgi:hypothetical protein
MSDPHPDASAPPPPLLAAQEVVDFEVIDLQEQPAASHPDNEASTDAGRPATKAEPPPAQSMQLTAQQLTDQALHFLSNASQETIGACLVGIGATTYLVLGRVGLVLMGVVGGVVLHATWDGTVRGTISEEVQKAEERRRKETSLDIVRRALSWNTSKTSEGDSDDEASEMRVEIVPGRILNYDDYPPETAVALNELTDAVIRDYVKYIFRPLWKPSC